MSQTAVSPEVAIVTHLNDLRRTIQALAKLHLSHSHELSGHQTVDSRQSLVLSFERMEVCVAEIEETLATITEATKSD